MHEFSRRRVRGPERVLSPGEAVELARCHVDGLLPAYLGYRDAFEELPEKDKWVNRSPDFYSNSGCL